MFVLEPAEAAKHSRKLLPYIHHYSSVTFKILYWSHALQISLGCFTRLTPKMLCKTRASIFKMIFFFLVKMAQITHAHLAMFHFIFVDAILFVI